MKTFVEKYGNLPLKRNARTCSVHVPKLPDHSIQSNTDANQKLTDADAVQILGAVYSRLCGQVCTTLEDMHANNNAQGLVLRLRHEAYTRAYPNSARRGF